MNVDEAALAAAHKVEDIFCRAYPGGRVQRLAAIQCAIAEAINDASQPLMVGLDLASRDDITATVVVDQVGRITHIGHSEHQGGTHKPASASERLMPRGSDAMAPHTHDVGAAPAVTDERPPQPITDRPASAEANHSAFEAVDPAVPVAPETQPVPQEAAPTKADRVLNIWATCPELTAEQIVSRVGCAVGSVKAFVSAARKKNDPRGFARKLPHDDKLSQPPALKRKPVLIPRKDEEREPPVAGFAKPVERKPFSKPLDPRPGRIAGVVITSPGTVVALDMDNLVVACPFGDWQVSRPVALIMERMRNGETFDDQTLAEVGSMGLTTFADSRKRWTEELATRGVEFVHTKGVGCKIRVAGA